MAKQPNALSGAVKLIVWIDYTNHVGITERRRVTPHFLWWGSSKYHKTDQHFMRAHCHERDAVRDFAMADIHRWSYEAPSVCEHGDHPAPRGNQFCSVACRQCEAATANHAEAECAGICHPSVRRAAKPQRTLAIAKAAQRGKSETKKKKPAKR